MRLTVSDFAAELDRFIDWVVETGEPIEIDRDGVIVRLVPPRPFDWLDRLPRREGVVVGDSDAIVHVDWSSEWKPWRAGSG